MTGITGATLGVPLLKLLGVTDPQIAGLSRGVAGHGIRTARALQLPEEAGAVAGPGLRLNGILTAVILPPRFPLLIRWGACINPGQPLRARGSIRLLTKHIQQNCDAFWLHIVNSACRD
ncbi:LrgB family protein [Paraburkholderia phenoliruptrix]|uniref:LrgB family protein n=1 Tax=Paraburkholderia phenoliruptrix TaxID=252970 RepID=UPI0034CF2142